MSESETNQSEKRVRAEEPELNDEALEEVAGGCGVDSLELLTITPTLPTIDVGGI